MGMQVISEKEMKLLVEHCMDHPEIQKWPIEKLVTCFMMLVKKFEKQNDVKFAKEYDSFSAKDKQ